MLALEGASTQYMWTTWRKRDPGWRPRAREEAGRGERVCVQRITNAHNSEPVAPNRGRFASVSIWVQDLPPDVDLFDLEVRVGGLAARGTYIGPPESNVQQINAILSDSDTTGLVPVELLWFGKPLLRDAVLRIIPAGPQVPRIMSVSDGVNLLSGTRIETGSVKVTIEEASRIEEFSAAIDGVEIEGMDPFCTDPLPQRWEVNFPLPTGLPPGPHVLDMRLGRRRFAPVRIEVTS